MKLRPFPITLNGNSLADDQFGFWQIGAEVEPSYIEFVCRGNPKRRRQCKIRITSGPADPLQGKWHWDGNRDAPTITPSIGCDARCGWHGHITKGEITP